MKDYGEIFRSIEETLIAIGAQTVSRKDIEAELNGYKTMASKQFSDEECYRKLVQITFYSGFKAQTVTNKVLVIDQWFPSFRTVASYGDRDITSILDDRRMIRHRGKIKASVENAKRFVAIVEKYGSFQAWVDALSPTASDLELLVHRDKFRHTFKFLGPRTAFHFMMDIGMPVLKPDRVVERIFKRLGVVPEELRESDALYLACIQAGRRFAQAAGYPIRYIDIVFVCYGQVQAKEIGIKRGICLSIEEGGPQCAVCGAKTRCDYYLRSRKARLPEP